MKAAIDYCKEREGRQVSTHQENPVMAKGTIDHAKNQMSQWEAGDRDGSKSSQPAMRFRQATSLAADASCPCSTQDPLSRDRREASAGHRQGP
jgi:hypothetical protein